MSYQVGVLEALADHGVNFRETPGCRTRGRSVFVPRGFVEHHDAIPGRWTYPPPIFTAGRPDVPPPLTNFATDYTGVAWVIALGAANHAGLGGWLDLSGNSTVWGNEIQNAGDDAQLYPDAQLETSVLLTAACADYSGFDAGHVCRHQEWAPTRKIDPRGPWPNGHRWQTHMDEFRALVAQGGIDDMYTDDDRAMITELLQAVQGVGAAFGQPAIPGLRELIGGPSIVVATVRGRDGAWITNGLQKLRSEPRDGLGKFAVEHLGAPRVEVTKALLDRIPDVA